MPRTAALNFLVELRLHVNGHVFVVFAVCVAIVLHLASLFAGGHYHSLRLFAHITEADSRYDFIEVLLLQLGNFVLSHC